MMEEVAFRNSVVGTLTAYAYFTENEEKKLVFDVIPAISTANRLGFVHLPNMN